ncbi:hypothetical protein MNBD_NITROSPIRAE01-1749 [hydrothermal vent metagenome]|uniref:Uncharacterized protein n=1 Tax=hydrothermal vent metagenome TaxID=652676 RepID=A0A3B1CCK6_9ZZZZ
MARYQPYSRDQSKFIPVFFDEQLLPGTFEHALNRHRRQRTRSRHLSKALP